MVVQPVTFNVKDGRSASRLNLSRQLFERRKQFCELFIALNVIWEIERICG